MPGMSVLLKVSGQAGGQGLTGSGSAGLTHLFTVPAPAAGAAGLASATASWYRLEPRRDSLTAASAHPWDIAHDAVSAGLGLGAAEVLAAEPDLEQTWQAYAPAAPTLAAQAAPACDPAPEKGSPYDNGPEFGWHLGDQFSQLAKARAQISDDAAARITVVHLDTGYDPAHRALPARLDHGREKNLLGDGPDAADRSPAGMLTNRGHGTGTIGILAGGDAGGMRIAEGLVPQGFVIGGAPGVRVVPVRIADSVVKFRTSTVAGGIAYAQQIGADVLSMSMGGLPSAAWADAVNAAYEAGVVLVCAAGNSFGGLPTSLIVYPARFGRVIAACGVMAGRHPYFGLRGPMEGCIGPAGKMATAMAAYTPNTPWLRFGCPDVIDRDGNGTSSATPQVAAAAALWLAKHGQAYPRGPARVEAVRAALFGLRDGQPAATPDPFFGRGPLRAADALGIVPDANHLVKTPEDSASFAFLKLLTSVFGIGPGAQGQSDVRQQMLRLEITQLALSSPGFQDAVPEPDAPPSTISDQARRSAMTALLDEGKASDTLRSYLAGVVGRSTPGWTAPRQPVLPTSVPIRPTDTVPRQISIPAPNRRRLRIFATDPIGSARLDTALINLATVEVPWETLQPGPIGEYVEVVDVDPASGVAYPMVDLGDPHLLAQDGIAPSEGNPQFHQQTVYAVVMRTIRNFEVALGRKALWAERRGNFDADKKWQAAPGNGYVQRLRVYPHALRQRNAFYSPQRKALLFGYYGDVLGPSRGRQVVFTCLSHDIVAHETTHALLDGLHRRFQEDTNPDVLAFHEAFADIVAIFQHFTFPELLRYELGRLRGDLTRGSILSDMARQFGQSLHNTRALRMALPEGTGQKATGDSEDYQAPLQNYRDTADAHDRGAILVAAMFEAFTAIYRRRTQGLIRLATAGSGVLSAGAIHPDLVEELAAAAVEVAQRILTTAIRALDYMPPVDPTFGDYLRAIVTADADEAPDHGMGYRVAFAEAFAKRGIYPDDVPSVSPDGLLWQASVGAVQSTRLDDFLRKLDLAAYGGSDRRQAFETAKRNAARLHDWMCANFDADMAASVGLDFSIRRADGTPWFEVHSVRPAQRTTVDGERRTDIVAVITQRMDWPVDPHDPSRGTFPLRGGCTLLLDSSHGTPPIRYAIIRPANDPVRAAQVRGYSQGPGQDPHLCYCARAAANEPFAAMHAALAKG